MEIEPYSAWYVIFVDLRSASIAGVDDSTMQCHHGVRSMRMAEFLESAGFADVVNISGGIHAVATEADPSIGTY